MESDFKHEIHTTRHPIPCPRASVRWRDDLLALSSGACLAPNRRYRPPGSSVTPDGLSTFASLAIAGDILGCETLLFGCYTFRATALTHCHMHPWPEGGNQADQRALLTLAGKAQQRAADLVALRGGQTADRVLGLMRLLADHAGWGHFAHSPGYC